MQDFVAVEAKREKIFVKVAILGPSGSGKTYTGLRLATGMLREMVKNGLDIGNGKILMGNTESSRGRYYANEFKYDIVDITSPHEPSKYEKFIKWAVEQKYPILLIDSSTHEWEGTGGCLEIHQKAGGTYQAWGKVTPLHNDFIETLADSPIHIIATMRGKDAYELEKTETGKLSVKKIGVGARQREGFEYEFTSTFLLDQRTNMAETMKDNTHLFEKNPTQLLSEEHGERLIQWANSGEGYTIPVRREGDLLEDLQQRVIERCKELGGSANKNLIDFLKKYEPTMGNVKKIKDLKILSEIYDGLDSIQVQAEEK